MNRPTFARSARMAVALLVFISIAAATACRAEIGPSSTVKAGDVVYVPNIDVNYLAYKCGVPYGNGSLRVVYEDGTELAMRSSGSPQSTALVFKAGGSGKHYLYFSDTAGTPRNDVFQQATQRIDKPAYYFNNGETLDIIDAPGYVTYFNVQVMWQSDCRWDTWVNSYSALGRVESYVFKRNGEQVPIPYTIWKCYSLLGGGMASILLQNPADYVFPGGYLEVIHYPLGWQPVAHNQLTLDRYSITYVPHTATAKLLSVERVVVASASAKAGADAGGAYAASGSSMLPASGGSPFAPADGNSDSNTDALPLAVPIAALGAAGLGAGFYYRREFLEAVTTALRGYEQTAQDYAMAKGEGVFDSDDYAAYKKANRSDYIVNGAVMTESDGRYAFLDRTYLTASLADKYKYLNEEPPQVVQAPVQALQQQAPAPVRLSTSTSQQNAAGGSGADRIRAEILNGAVSYDDKSMPGATIFRDDYGRTAVARGAEARYYKEEADMRVWWREETGEMATSHEENPGDEEGSEDSLFEVVFARVEKLIATALEKNINEDTVVHFLAKNGLPVYYADAIRNGMAHNAFMVTTATNPFALAEDSAEMWAAYGITSWFRIDGYAPFFLVNTGVDMFTSIAIKGEDPVKVAEREAFRVPVNLVAIKGWEYLAPRIPVLGPYLSGEAASIGGVPLGLLGIYGMTGIGVAVQVNAYAQVIKGRYQELLWLTEEVDKARVKALGAPATLKDRYLALNGWYQAEKKMLEKYEEYGLSLGIANTLSLGWRSDLGYLTSTIEKEVRAWDEWRGTYSQTWRILDKAYGRIEQTS